MNSSSDASINLPEAARRQGSKSAQIIRKILLMASWILVLLLGALLISLFLPTGRRAADRTEAMNNMKQIGLSLQEFESDYGRFPDESTAGKVRMDTGTRLSLAGSSSNALFRQLLVTGFKSEKPFFCKRAGSRRPDDNISDDAHALAPGECGFAYVAGLSSAADPETPVVMAPMIPGTARFDPSIYKGKAVILFLGQSVGQTSIDPGGHVMVNGMDLFDPRQPFWHGKTPDLRLPE